VVIKPKKAEMLLAWDDFALASGDGNHVGMTCPKVTPLSSQLTGVIAMAAFRLIVIRLAPSLPSRNSARFSQCGLITLAIMAMWQRRRRESQSEPRRKL